MGFLFNQTASDWQNGVAHIDIWTGTVADGGDAQIECENQLTPDPRQSFIRNPASDLEVDCKLKTTNSQGKQKIKPSMNEVIII